MKSFSAMTANLRFGRADDGKNGWDYRKEAMVEVFKTYQPDILAVQEANDFQAHFLIERLEEYGHVGFRPVAPAFWQSNIIFYKNDWVLKDKKHFFMSYTPEVESKWEDSKWPRQCTMALLEKDGRSLACADTHFDFLSEVQVRSARLLLEMLEDFAPGSPALVMGDFNADPQSPCRQVFEAEGGFADPFDGRFGGTHHGFTGKPVTGRIDWMLYRGEVQPILHTRKIVRDRFLGKYPSDHFPVYCNFHRDP